MSFANSKPTLRLIDGSDLVDLIFEHYENFDSRFRALLPLKRVFVPDVAATEPN
jgi:restriction system protein